MARRARLCLARVPVHLIQRGNNRLPCFFAPNDYAAYLHYLGELSGRYDCRVHAYVLMTNHVHLLLTPEAAEGPSLLMKDLGQRYAQYVNRKYERSGTLWQGRFKSCLVQSEAYLLRCYRYIEVNPVRAAIVRHPRDYRWSSYRANAEGATSALVVAHDEYCRLGKSMQARRRAYRALFDDVLDPAVVTEIRDATNGNLVFGDSPFQREIEAALGTRIGRGAAGRPRKIGV